MAGGMEFSTDLTGSTRFVLIRDSGLLRPNYK